jgi:hypothetical protein
VRAIYRKLPLWNRCHKIEGIFCESGRDDAVFLTTIGLHHTAGGVLMLCWGTVRECTHVLSWLPARNCLRDLRVRGYGRAVVSLSFG